MSLYTSHNDNVGILNLENTNQNASETWRGQGKWKWACSVHLKSAGQKLVFDLQEVSSAHLPFEGLVENGKPHVVLHILPPSVAVAETRTSSVTTYQCLIIFPTKVQRTFIWNIHLFINDFAQCGHVTKLRWEIQIFLEGRNTINYRWCLTIMCL